MQIKRYGAAVLVASALAGACVVHQTDEPPLTGPSVLAQSLSLTATPAAIAQDGASQSAVMITAFDASGHTVSALPIRLEMRVNGTIQDFGTLSARNVVTGSDGRASVVYTAPPPPAPGSTIGTCGSLQSGALAGPCVTIVATPANTNAQTASASTVDIRLVPPGVILPPVIAPLPGFTMLPSGGVLVGQSVAFDASQSCPGPLDTNGKCTTTATITSVAWDFGDGGTGAGMRATHAFASGGTFIVTVTVTNNSGGAASISQSIDVGLPPGPTAKFVFSPGSPAAGTVVFFDATPSTSAFGHNIVQFNWNFGDGNSASGMTTTNKYLNPGTYIVTLSVVDDTGQRSVATTQVTVS